MNALWSLGELVEAMNAEPLGSPPQEIGGISIDARTLQAGDAFFAIRGERFDGHDFLFSARKAGASLAVIDRRRLESLGEEFLRGEFQRGGVQRGGFQWDEPLRGESLRDKSLSDWLPPGRVSLRRIPSGGVPPKRSPPRRVLPGLLASGLIPPLLAVDNVRAALERLGKTARTRSRAVFIAVTGSSGKTTVKEMIRTILAPCGKLHASPASFNNHWGVPLTLARTPRDASYAVLEIGMNNPGEIARLSGMVRPDVAVVANVGEAHLGAFDSLESIARAKAEIFRGVEEGGIALIEGDGEYSGLLRRLAGKAGIQRIFSFGSGEGCDFRIVRLPRGDSGLRVEALAQRRELKFDLQAHGEHMALNALAALAASILSGVRPGEESLEALAKFSPGAGRGERRVAPCAGGGTFTLIDESYNANPSSMRAALLALSETPAASGAKRIAVLGDMKELGKESGRLHAELSGLIRKLGIDSVFLCGEEMKPLADELRSPPFEGHYDSVSPLIEVLRRVIGPGDVVMAKASNAMRFSVLSEALAPKPPEPEPKPQPKPKAKRKPKPKAISPEWSAAISSRKRRPQPTPEATNPSEPHAPAWAARGPREPQATPPQEPTARGPSGPKAPAPNAPARRPTGPQELEWPEKESGTAPGTETPAPETPGTGDSPRRKRVWRVRRVARRSGWTPPGRRR